MQAEGDEATNTSVEEAPQDGEPAEAKEGEAVEDKVGVNFWVLNVNNVTYFFCPQAPEDVEPKTMTLDEWKALQKGQKKEEPKFNVRKAGEGSDIDPKWKKATSYKKQNEEESEEEEEEEVGPAVLVSSVPIHLHFDFSFVEEINYLFLFTTIITTQLNSTFSITWILNIAFTH